MFSVCCSVEKDQYREVIAKSGILERTGLGGLGRLWLKTPYNLCFHQIISLTLQQIVNKLGIRGDVVDFVFDKNAPHFEAANKMLTAIRAQGFSNAPEWESTLGEVVEADDKTLPPLQMADLFAARVKDQCSDGKNSHLIRSLLAVSGKGDTNITFHAKRKHIEALLGASEIVAK
jgi:hypothetical protein